MYKLKPQKINFDNKLCSSFTGHIYPYQKAPGDHRYVVKHIMAHDIDELFLFLQEVILGFNCDHPSIHSVQGYHIEKIQPRGFNIYIKYNRNVESLTHVIERCRNEKKYLTEEEIIKILYNISCGLEYLHNKNIAHKNIKPIDIMIDSEGKAQLGGIGTNEILEDNKANVLFAKSVVSCYKAPELQSSTQKLKRRDLFKADVWSLGVNIAELCVLKTDFVNFSLQSPKKIEADIQKKLKGLEGRYSKAFMELLSGMLRYDPAQRKHIKDIRIMLEEQFTSILVILSLFI